MERVLVGFIGCLRHAGLRVSTSETLDALAAVQLAGYEDRNVLKDVLSATLVKSVHKKDVFSRCFDHFFSLRSFSGDATNPMSSLKEFLCDSEQADNPSLVHMMIMENQAALAMALQEAAREANLKDIQFVTQRKPYAAKILDIMGIQAMDRMIGHLKAQGTSASSGQAAALEKARALLKDTVREYVDRQLDITMSSDIRNQGDSALRHTKLSTLEERHLQEIERIIRRMVKRLRDRSSRRRKTAHRGHLDFKKTLRKNMAFQGFLFNTQWKKKKVDRPELVVICDISKSVMRTVRFLLMFVYGLNQVVSRVRTFILCSNLVEVTALFESLPVETAIEKIRLGDGLPILMGHTDYNQSFLDFRDMFLHSVSRKTTVIILGDARNNYQEGQTGVLKTIHERSKRLVWLNPEESYLWGSGDSEMKQYIPFCSIVQECNTLHHLEEVVRKTLSL